MIISLKQHQERIAKRVKSFRGLKVVDSEQGTFTATFATFNVVDLDGDITLPGAFENGANVLISAYGHKSWMGAKPVGRGVIDSDATRAWVDGQFFMDTIDGLDTFRTIKGTAELQEWSYGYDVLENGDLLEGMQQQGAWRVIAKSLVHEVCPVMLGAGIDTETTALKSAKLTTAAVDDAAIATGIAARREFARYSKTRAGQV